MNALFARRNAPPRHRLWMVLLAMCTLLIAGCQGCRDDSEQTAEQQRLEEAEKEEREKPTYETEPAVIYPGQYSDVTRKNRTKRGHWVASDFRVIANQSDVQGELTATCYTGSGQPVVIEATDYYAVSARPFSIPQGELRELESGLYIPRRTNNPSASINYSIARRAGGTPQFTSVEGTITMNPYQYHIVLLTNRPDDYQYLNLIDSVRVPSVDALAGGVPEFYTVVRTKPSEEPIALPRHALYWTTIAYLIWDDLQVDQLDAEQQQALIDWIHFGGQLILSGPDCLEQLSDSFLADYLPAETAGAGNLVAADFEAINQNWAFTIPGQDRKQELRVSATQKILGVKFKPHPKAQYIANTGQIAIERQVGRGRIVATAFSMHSKPIIRWSGFQNFFNGCLLRRPGRKFEKTTDDTVTFTWLNDDTSIFDPLMGSTLRYLSRDLANPGFPIAAGTQPGTPVAPDIQPRQIARDLVFNDVSGMEFRFRSPSAVKIERRNLDDDWHYGGFQHDGQSGTAGWNDNSGISVAALEVLRQAAGISPPSSDFVLRLLVVYLVVLVPVNWIIFRLIGRVEWAWIAAPVIAIVGAVMVVRLASLDIGFVRSNSQVGSVEIYGDYRRAHVAQYSALYTSLSTGYDIQLDNASAQALPLGQPSDDDRQKTVLPVVFHQSIGRRLENLQVDSNSTGMVHSEMMFDLNGVFSLDDSGQLLRIENSTSLDLNDAAVLKRNATGQLQSAWIGEFASHSISPALQLADVENAISAWRQSDMLAPQRQADDYWATLLQDASQDSDPRFSPIMMRQRLPAINDQWEPFLGLLRRRFPELQDDKRLNMPMGYTVFRDLVLELTSEDQVNVSPILQAVTTKLEMAPGEIRLIAMTDQQIGNQAFEPASTQSQQQSLVVVHLKRPPLPVATPDVNSASQILNAFPSYPDWPEGNDEPQDMPNKLDEDP